MTATTHRATQEQGPPIVNGRLLWTSATGITTADPHSFGGCTRKWFYDTVQGRKGPPTKAMLAGTGLHTEIENRLLRGASVQSPLALAGSHFIPHAGGGLYVEKPIHFTTRDEVQIYGHVDLYNLRGEYIDPDGKLQQDPPWSMEVKDWKTTSSFDYAKTERELAENIQLVTYAEAGFRMWPDLEHGRLTHVYFRTRGAPASKLVTIRRSREEIAARWEYNESVVRCMADVAKEQGAERVPANTRSCTAYGGCPHSSYCSAYRSTSLDNLYNKIAEDHLNDRAKETATPWGPGSTAQPNARVYPEISRCEQEQPGVQSGAVAYVQEAVRAEAGGNESARDAHKIPVAVAPMQFVANAIPGANSFSGSSVPDLPSPFRRDQNKVQPAYAGTFAQRNAVSWGDVQQLQSHPRSCEGQSDRAAERDPLPGRTITMGLIATTQPQLMQQATSQQQLAAEEQAMRAQVAQQQQQMPQQQFNAAEFLTVCHRLGSYGFGMPSLAGNAAQAYAAAGGQSVAPGFVYQGLIAPPGAQYSLHGMTLTEVTQVYQIEREAAAKVNPQPAPSFPPVQMPAGTPPVTQAIANAYNQTVANQALPAQPMQMQQVSFLPPGAPESMPQLAMQQSAPPQQTADPTEEPKKAGRPKKQKSQDAAPEPTAAVMQGPPPSSPAPAPQVAPAAESAIPQEKVGGGFVLINARFSDVDTKSLASYVDYVNAELSKRYCVTADGKPCPQDVRCAPKDSPLAFGGWKGAVREVVKADPPPAGLYHLDTFLDELNEAVADALRIVANQRGWFYVRGVR